MITKAELARLRSSARIVTDADIQRSKENAEAVNKEKMAKSRARKARMAHLAAEAKRKAPKSDVELLAEAERASLLKLAEQQRDEELDSVKHLATLGARAAAFTIRKQQIREAEERFEREKLYDVKCNVKMELDRLEGLKDQEKEERRKKDQRYKDKEVLLRQIAAREEERQKRQDEIVKEGLQEKARQARVLEEEKMKAIQILEKKKAAQLEVIKSNETARIMKIRVKEREQEEDEKNVAYQQMMNEKAAALEAQKAAEAEAKELRCAELRKMQERSNDKQSALDELRAKRAAEDKERKARQAEKAAAEKKKVAAAELLRAHHHQQKFTVVQRARQFKEQKLEYERICAETAKQKALVLAEEKKKHTERLQNKQIVLRQIAEKEKMRAYARFATRAEGDIIKKEFNAERGKMETIRTKMIASLARDGVDPTYLAEMKRVDMAKLQMR